MSDFSKYTLRTMVKGAYMLQNTRIRMGNRIAANFRAKLGIEPSQKEEDSGKENTKILQSLKLEYSRLTDGIVSKRGIPRKIMFAPVEQGLITDYVELLLMNQYEMLLKEEKQIFKDVGSFLDMFPIWTDFMEGIHGVGPTLAGLLIAEIDIHKAKYASSLHKYCGLDVVIDKDGIGSARSRRKEHLEDYLYLDSDGEEKTKKGLTYKPILKTKLLGVLAPSFVKVGARCDSKYEKLYRNYKNRITNMPAHAEKTKAHLNNMALRYAVKIFIIDLYAKWRELEGLEVHPPYHEAKLGLSSHKDQ